MHSSGVPLRAANGHPVYPPRLYAKELPGKSALSLEIVIIIHSWAVSKTWESDVGDFTL